MAPPAALLPNTGAAVAGTAKQLFYNFLDMITVMFSFFL